MQDGTPIIIKKVRKGGHGHHGGAWKVALADFMTAMMAFFLVMWIVGLSQDERSLIQAYFNDPIGFSKNPPKSGINILPPSGPKKQEENKKVAEQTRIKQAAIVEKVGKQVEAAIKADKDLQKMEKAGFIKVDMTPNGLVIEFIENQENGEVFFKIGSSEIRPTAFPVIGKVAQVLAASGRTVQIQGHTDARPYPGAGYDNYDLSGDRANAVRRQMMKAGLKQSQVDSVDAMADTQPRVPGNPNHFSNRRVTVLLPFAATPAQIKELPKDGFAEDRAAHFILPKDIAPERPEIKPGE